MKQGTIAFTEEEHNEEMKQGTIALIKHQEEEIRQIII